MASSIKNLSQYDENEVIGSGKGKRFALVVSTYHKDITFSLLRACLSTMEKHQVSTDDMLITYVPGAYELIAGAAIVAKQHPNIDAIVTIGCVIKGETDHDKYINQSVAQGLMQLTVKHSKPFIFGLLTPDTHQQALDRSGGIHGNKGVEVAIAAISMSNI